MPKYHFLHRFLIAISSPSMLLGACSPAEPRQPTSENSRIQVTFTQGALQSVIDEDLRFQTFLNSPVSDEEAPSPDWHSIAFTDDTNMSIQLKNCDFPDVIELIFYPMIGKDGKPVDFEYLTLCSPDENSSCDTSMNIPQSAADALMLEEIQQFAVSGICIQENSGEAQSFISFVKKQ